jgi:DNA repair exonuclease SbcCD ATPase subunit
MSNQHLIREAPSKERAWHELSDSEKIERMRSYVKERIKWISINIANLENKIEALKKHKHLPTGEIVVGIEQIKDNYSDLGMLSDDKYF